MGFSSRDKSTSDGIFTKHSMLSKLEKKKKRNTTLFLIVKY